MAKKSNLPTAVHDHFRKANILHGYTEKDMSEGTKHALETGQELIAAKKLIPHGRWETECKRLFDPSLRTAQFYIQFTKDFSALPKAQQSALLFLEGSLDGAAKAAKKAAKPKPPKPAPEPNEPIDVDSEPVADQKVCHDCKGEDFHADGTCRSCPRPEPEDLGKCPNCACSKWEKDEAGVSCVKCHHPHGEPAGDADEDRIKTQRQKTQKTAEALMRAFDDLQCMKAKAVHREAIGACKGLLKIAKEWQ